jgi:hypothetical protein
MILLLVTRNGVDFIAFLSTVVKELGKNEGESERIATQPLTCALMTH